MEKFSKEILKAKSGIEAIEIIRNNPDINFILMDIKLPGIDGYETVRQIRQFNQIVIIIAQTAYAQIGDKEKALAAGCNYYLTKPMQIEILETLLTEQLKQSLF